MTSLTLEDFHTILGVPLHMRPYVEWPMWLRAKLRAGGYVLGAKLRVDEASLRKREMDVLPKLLAEIARAKRMNPALQDRPDGV